MGTIALALHGGAGASRKLDYHQQVEHMRTLVEEARRRLQNGDRAIDVVQMVVSRMELSGLYVAGKGGSPNLAGTYELDACLMDGRSRRAGAVACITGFQSPISVARLVIQKTPHVLLSGAGAEEFALRNGAARIPEDVAWFTHVGAGESNHAPDFLPASTVGCVALDRNGNLAAATSSAGVFGKVPGRVGDSPLPGCGTWADDMVAVSCTGQGELFIQGAAAAQLAFRVRAGSKLGEAAAETLADVTGPGGMGGMVAIDVDGEIAIPFRAEGMKRAVLTKDGRILTGVFDDWIEHS